MRRMCGPHELIQLGGSKYATNFPGAKSRLGVSVEGAQVQYLIYFQYVMRTIVREFGASSTSVRSRQSGPPKPEKKIATIYTHPSLRAATRGSCSRYSGGYDHRGWWGYPTPGCFCQRVRNSLKRKELQF